MLAPEFHSPVSRPMSLGGGWGYGTWFENRRGFGYECGIESVTFWTSGGRHSRYGNCFACRAAVTGILFRAAGADGCRDVGGSAGDLSAVGVSGPSGTSLEDGGGVGVEVRTDSGSTGVHPLPVPARLYPRLTR